MGSTTPYYAMRYPFDGETISDTNISNYAADAAAALDLLDIQKTGVLKRPAATAQRLSSTQNITANTDTDMQYDLEVFDTDAGVALGTNNTRYTCPAGQGGLFYCIAHLPNTGATGWGSGMISIRKNGSSVYRRKVWSNVSPNAARDLFVSGIVDLVPTDFVTASILFQGTPSPSAIQFGFLQVQKMTG